MYAIRSYYEEALKILAVAQKKFSFELTFEQADVGGIAIDNHGAALPRNNFV